MELDWYRTIFLLIYILPYNFSTTGLSEIIDTIPEYKSKYKFFMFSPWISFADPENHSRECHSITRIEKYSLFAQWKGLLLTALVHMFQSGGEIYLCVVY